MPSIQLTDEQACELRSLLWESICHLVALVGDSSHPDDIIEVERKTTLEGILTLLENA
jgi:hypothetical protein